MHPNHSSKQASHAGRGPPARTPCGALHSRTTTSRRAVPATFTNPKTKNRLGAMTRRPKALRRAHQMSPGIPKTPVVLVQHDIKQAATPQNQRPGFLASQTANLPRTNRACLPRPRHHEPQPRKVHAQRFLASQTANPSGSKPCLLARPATFANQ